MEEQGLISDHQTGDLSPEVLEGFTLINVGGGQGESRHLLAEIDNRVTLEAVIKLILGGTVPLGDLTRKQPTTMGPGQMTDGHRQAVRDVGNK